MKLYIRITIIIQILAISFILTASSFHSGNWAEAIDPYEKYQGEKIPVSGQTSNISGTFGDLEITPFILQPTADFILHQTDYNDLFPTLESGNQWIFKNTTLEEIQSLFMDAGLDAGTCKELLSCTTAIPNGKGYITTPADSFFWNLTSGIKAKLYPLIGEYTENPMYSDPLYFYSDNAGEWFYNSGLSDEIVNELLHLVYKNNGISYLSDTHLIIPYLSEDEYIRFLKAAYRTKSMDISLVIKEGENINSIAEYWGSLGRTADIASLLESLSNEPGGGKINIEELLPEMPKERLNTFSGYDEFQEDRKDCHWTTINFYNDEIDERYYNLPDIFDFLTDISNPLKEDSELKFGDIISIFDENNNLVHSCTYIVGNLTLTKNGLGNLRPFVFSYLDKTISLYGAKSIYLSRSVADTNSVKLIESADIAGS